MEEELRLLRRAHEEQAKHTLAERLVAADRIRTLELQVEQLKREAADAHRSSLDEHEKARRHVEAARAERDAAVGQLADFEETPTYRMVMLVRRVLARAKGGPT
jgi:hypothetical protein